MLIIINYYNILHVGNHIPMYADTSHTYYIDIIINYFIMQCNPFHNIGN